MKSKKLVSFLLAAVFVLSIALSGCSKNQQPSASDGQSSEDKIDADQTVKIVGYDYKSLDPSAESDAETFTTFNQVYEGLARENADHKIVLAGAEKMDVSQDGLVYTFTLKKDAKWSDGKPVTAKDYEYSWKRLIDPKAAHDYGGFIYMVKNVPEYQDGKAKLEDVGIKAVDDYTFQVTLSTPTPFFSNMISFFGLVPQREDIVTSLGKDYGQAYDKMVYNGPFTVAEYQKGSKIVYKKNPNYWDAKNVKLEKAECPIISEPATLVQMFQAKQLDQTGASGDFIAQLKSGADAGGYEYITGNDASSYWLAFNFKNPILANQKIRAAMSAAFDKQGLLDTVYKRFVAAYDFLPAGLYAGDTDFRKAANTEPVKTQIDAVKDPKALFIEGLKELGKDPDPSKYSFKYLLGPATSTSTANGAYVQDQFEKKIGCKIEIVHAVDSPAYFQSRTKGEFDLYGGGWGADFNDVSNFMDIFTTGNGNNNGKYSNKEFDDLVAQGAKETDSAKRVELYKQAEDILLNKDVAVIMTYHADFQTFKYKYLKGIFLPLFGGYYCLKDAYIQGKTE